MIDKPTAPPGARFVYSDINFILLGEIVRRLSGETLAEFAHEEIYAPLGMNDTLFQPPAALKPRIAPTEIDEDTGLPLRGVVHDETSRFMGGIAGHAGLFTTAADLSRFAQMMLGLGAWVDPATGKEVRIFSPLTVRKFTEPGSPADQAVIRALGWDLDSPFSSNRGELFPIGSYGHTGFTGTSIWLDPSTQTYVIVLTNVVHPKRGKSLSSFRSRLATTVAASLGVDVPGVSLTGYNETMTVRAYIASWRAMRKRSPVSTCWRADSFAALRGKRIGLITNHTGLDRSGRRNVDAMLAAGLKVTALYSPEHGLAGVEDSDVCQRARSQRPACQLSASICRTNAA